MLFLVPLFSNSNAGFVFCLPFKHTFSLLITYMLQYEKSLQNSKQLPFYLFNIQWVRTLGWAQLGVSSADPAEKLRCSGSRGPQSHVQLSHMCWLSAGLDLSLHMASYLPGVENLGLLTYSSVLGWGWGKPESSLRTKLGRPITLLHHAAG